MHRARRDRPNCPLRFGFYASPSATSGSASADHKLEAGSPVGLLRRCCRVLMWSVNSQTLLEPAGHAACALQMHDCGVDPRRSAANAVDVLRGKTRSRSAVVAAHAPCGKCCKFTRAGKRPNDVCWWKEQDPIGRARWIGYGWWRSCLPITRNTS